MMIPEAWEHHEHMDPDKRAFYRFHASVMEPWDGPASVAFTDGTVIGAVLDRNGLRPSRYWVTDDDLVIMASEVGVIDVDQSRVVRKGRLQPGRMLLVDTAQGRIVDDEEIKATLAAEHPYEEWLHAGIVHLGRLPEREHIVYGHESVRRRQQVFGYTHEELKIIIAPMARTGYEPIGSMGTDTPIAVLSDRPRLLFDYFQQLFAQVTNPPLDAIREELVTALGSTVGPEGNLLQPGPASCRQVVLPFPIISNDDLAKIIHINQDGDLAGFGSAVISGLYRVAGGGLALKRALDSIRTQVSQAIDEGARIIVLSDRNADEVYAPIPSLLLTSAVHHHLIREKTRTKVGLIVEAGDAREVHHMALLVGFGAGAINPYLAFESIEDMIAASGGTGVHGLGGTDPAEAVERYIKAAGKGVLKVMSKMGVSTVASYTGAQIFEAIGLVAGAGRRVLHRHRLPPRRRRPGRAGGRGGGPPSRRAPRPARGAGPPLAGARRRVPVAAGGRAPPLQPGDGVQAAARHAGRPLRRLQAVHPPGRRPVASPGHPAGPVRAPPRRPAAGPARGGRAGQRDRPPLLDRGHVLRLDLGRGPRDPRHRHEPPRRQEQHRRGRRGRRALRAAAQRRLPALGHQAGGVRALRRDERVPGQRRRPADQDGAGGQAGRGRPAPRPQGVPVDRQDPALDARASG